MLFSPIVAQAEKSLKAIIPWDGEGRVYRIDMDTGEERDTGPGADRDTSELGAESDTGAVVNPDSDDEKDVDSEPIGENEGDTGSTPGEDEAPTTGPPTIPEEGEDTDFDTESTDAGDDMDDGKGDGCGCSAVGQATVRNATLFELLSAIW